MLARPRRKIAERLHGRAAETAAKLSCAPERARRRPKLAARAVGQPEAGSASHAAVLLHMQEAPPRPAFRANKPRANAWNHRGLPRERHGHLADAGNAKHNTGRLGEMAIPVDPINVQREEAIGQLSWLCRGADTERHV